MAGRPPAADRRRRTSAALFGLVLAVLVLLNLAPAPWAEASRLRETVPKFTPTRPVTVTRTATPGRGPSATPTPTLRPGQPSPTPIPPGAAATPGSPAQTPEAGASPAATESPAPGATAAATSTPVIVRNTPVSVPAWATNVLPPGTIIETPVAGSTPPPGEAGGLIVSVEGAIWCTTQPGAQTLRWAGKPAVLEIPAGAITDSVCVFFSPLDTSGLAAPPSGYAFGSLAANVLMLTGDQGFAGLTFAKAVTLTLPLAASDSASGAPAIGFLGEGSTGWALLKSERDQAASTITVQSRRPGSFAILVAAPQAAAASQQAQQSPTVSILAGVAAIFLLLLATIVLLSRRRRLVRT